MCDTCKGTGKYCKCCNNDKYLKIAGTIPINAKNINKYGETKVFKRMGNEKKGFINGDVIVTFKVW